MIYNTKEKKKNLFSLMSFQSCKTFTNWDAKQSVQSSFAYKTKVDGPNPNPNPNMAKLQKKQKQKKPS